MPSKSPTFKEDMFQKQVIIEYSINYPQRWNKTRQNSLAVLYIRKELSETLGLNFPECFGFFSKFLMFLQNKVKNKAVCVKTT